MRKPREWLDEYIAGRPDDFSADDIDQALYFIARIQADAIESHHRRLLALAQIIVLALIALIVIALGKT